LQGLITCLALVMGWHEHGELTAHAIVGARIRLDEVHINIDRKHPYPLPTYALLDTCDCCCE
jgi:hypothetical protein